VSTYLEKVDAEETIDQAWGMFTDAYKTEKDAKARGKDGFRNFWKSVDTVQATGELSVIEPPTATRVVVQLPVKFMMIPELIAPEKSPCSTENDDFTIVRINGVLQIDRGPDLARILQDLLSYRTRDATRRRRWKVVVDGHVSNRRKHFWRNS
jgi:hypothetical protein